MQTTLRHVAVLVFASLVCYGQFSLRSRITGFVKDPAGSLVPGAAVSLKDIDRNQTILVHTDGSGSYTFNNLNMGRYQVTVEAKGFRTAVSAEIEVATQQAVRLDIPLEIGAVAETVTIGGSAALLQTEQANLGTVVNREFLESLPVRGHNFSGFAALSPNISITEIRSPFGITDSSGARHVGGGIKFRSNGGGDNDYSINGINSEDNYVDLFNYAPSLEAVSEVKVDVSGSSAEYGHNVVNVNASTRGGTGAFHGAIYDSFGNSALNAVNPYTKATTASFKKPMMNRHMPGGNIGGPILIPKLLKSRDRAFFFVNYERLVHRSGGNLRITRVPTTRERQGDFGELLTRFPGDPNYILYNPFSTVLDANGNSVRAPVPGNDLRNLGPGVIDKRSQDMLNLYPLPTGYRDPSNPNSLNNFLVGESRGFDSYRLDSRFDYRFSANDNVFVAMSKSHGTDSNQNALFPDLAKNPEDQTFIVTFNYVRVFKPNLTNEFIFGFNRPRYWDANQEVLDYMARKDTLFGKYINNLDFRNFPGVYLMNISGLTSVGFNPFLTNRPTYQFSDNLSWVHGAHSIKTGINYIFKRDFGPYTSRTVNFTNGFTRAGTGDPDPTKRSRGGDGIATFLLGIPASMNQNVKFESGEPTQGAIFQYWAGYLEDKWQVSPRLTLSLGLRYDLSIPMFSGDTMGFATLDYTYPGWQLVVPGRADGWPRRFNPADKNNFAPRISLAYRLNAKTVLRSSFAQFYVVGSGSTLSPIWDLQFSGNYAYSPQSFTNASYKVSDEIPYFTMDNVFPTPPTASADRFPVSTGKGTGYYAGSFNSVTFRDKQSEVLPYYLRYTTDIQRTVGQSTVITISYSGSRGIKLPYTENLNKPPYRTGWASTAVQNAARPNTTGSRWADVRVYRNGLNSFNNSGTIRFDHRLSHGLQVFAHYTFSKTVEDSNAFEYNRWLGRGEASYSHPHRVYSAVTYTVPTLGAAPRFAKAVVAGWQISAIAMFESGNALTVTNNASSTRDREPNRPYLVADPNLAGSDRTFYRYFNTAAFLDPGQDVKGNAGSGIVRGPGINNWDLSIAKSFKVIERLRLDFRAEFYNAFNHTQWSSVDTGFNTNSTTTFGRVNGARDARATLLTAKVWF